MPELTDNELEIMRILCDEAPLKPLQIGERFSRPIDNGTLRSALASLMEKRQVKRGRAGKAFIYSPLVGRPGLIKSVARRLSQFLTDGSSAELVMELARTERFTPEQARELKRIASAHAGSAKKRGAK